MIISYSETLAWDSCPRQFYYQIMLKKFPDTPEAMAIGVKGHSLLQSFYQGLQEGLPPVAAKESVTKQAKKILETASPDDLGQLLKAWTIVEKYINETNFKYEVALVENRFLIPLSRYTDDPLLQDVQIGFTPDVVFKRMGDFYTVEDSKFVSKAWPRKKLNRFPQAKLYEIFLQNMGYNVTRSSVRFFNLTTSKIYNHSHTMTPQEAKILIKDFVATVREIVIYKTSDNPENIRRTMNYSACQYCLFELPCTTEAEGKSAVNIFKHLYKDNKYDYTA